MNIPIENNPRPNLKLNDPNNLFVVVAPNPCSGTFVLPGNTAPFFLIQATILSSDLGR